MIFIIKTPKGSEIELDTDKIKEVIVSLDNVDYKISIEQT